VTAIKTVAKSPAPVEQTAYLSALVTMVLWSSAFAGIEAALVDYNAYQLTLLRFGTASLAFAVYAAITRLPLPEGRDLPKLILGGLTGITCYHLALNLGQQMVTATTASLIIATSPLFTAILSGWLLKEKFTVTKWIGMGVCLGGILIMILSRGEQLEFTKGALLVLFSAMVIPIYFVLQKPLLTRYHPVQLSAYFTWLGTLPLLVFCRGLGSAIAAASAGSTLAAVYLGLFPAAAAYVTWSYTLARLPAGRASSFLYLNPPLAALIAYLWVGEVPLPAELLGGAIVLAGIYLVNHKGRNR